MSRVDTVGTSQQRGGGAAQFAPVPRLPTHHVHGSTLDEGGRFWSLAVFGGSVSLTITHAGLHTGCTLTPAVARALANELLACAAVYGGE